MHFHPTNGSQARALASIALAALASGAAGSVAAGERLRFFDDFEGDLKSWRLVGDHALSLVESGDAGHQKVLELRANGLVYALVRGSENWGPLRIEADFLFPDDRHNYLGLVYNLSESNDRVDFGSVYVKGNGSYLRANPWRDGNASRLLYEEYRTPLEHHQRVVIGRWHRFVAEVKGRDCHVYIGETKAPDLTFDLFEGTSGPIGFKPRIVGWPVWIDNVRVTSIDRPSYDGPPIPEIAYDATDLLTDWEVFGPLHGPSIELERGEAKTRSAALWRPFAVDRRGAVVTGRVTEYASERPVAYFRTRVSSNQAKEAVLHFSTTDELALFVNGQFNGFVYRDGYLAIDNDWNAWHDFALNPDHVGTRVRVPLREGSNEIVLRVRNGQFASGGFFGRLETVSGNPAGHVE